MARTTLPLFPTDDGWPYPDSLVAEQVFEDSEPDLDALELRADPHAFDGLAPDELRAVIARFGLDGSTPRSLKELSVEFGCSRAEVRDSLGRGIDKLRTRLRTD
jgi:DNA-directed RNA polymerase sigma subunit (sigma70/sigma32)